MTQLDSPGTAANAAGVPAGAAPSAQTPISPPSPEATVGTKRRRRLGRRGVVVLIGALVLLLGGAGYGAWALFLSGSGQASTQYRTVIVAKETLKSTVSATGTLNPAKESELSFSSSGEVSSVKVEVGDQVSKGDVLARIDDDELQIDYDAAKAELTEAEDSLDELTDDDDATDTAIASAEASVKVKENAVKQAKAALHDATLVAPFSGTIAAVGIEKGDTVGSSSGSTGSSGANSSGSSGSSSSESITVISTGTFVVDTSVSNTDLTSIKKGLQATITPTGSDQPVFGTVSSVGVVATSSDSSSDSSSNSGSSSGSSGGSATFPVTIAVTGKHTDLLPGSSATVDITVKQLADVISVPTQAISTVDGKTVVQKLVDGKQVQTGVTIGQVIGTSTVITKGLSEGDEVVVASFTAAAGSGTRTGNRNQDFGPGSGGFPGGGTFQGQGAPPNGTGGTGGNANGGTRGGTR